MSLLFLPSKAMVDHFDMIETDGKKEKVVGYIAKTKNGFLGFTRVLTKNPNSIDIYRKYFFNSRSFKAVKDDLIENYLERGFG